MKNDTQPLANVPNFLGLTGIMSPNANETYSLLKNYAAPNFFGDWWLDNRNGHVFGFSQFVGDNDTAWNKGLFGYQGDKVSRGASSEDRTFIISLYFLRSISGLITLQSFQTTLGDGSALGSTLSRSTILAYLC